MFLVPYWTPHEKLYSIVKGHKKREGGYSFVL
jgi:hypothetical protein